jgi:hypothetical protein
MGGLPDEGGVPVMGRRIYWSSVLCLLKREEVSLIRPWRAPEFPSSSDRRTIFLRRSTGMEEAYFSAKLKAPERLEEGSRGYIKRRRPMMVSTSPTPSTRREISSRGESEKEIR